MFIDERDAGDIGPSPKRYRVVYAHGHATLRYDDIVVMVNTPKYERLLLRVSDMTLHVLQGEYGQYVHLATMEAQE